MRELDSTSRKSARKILIIAILVHMVIVGLLLLGRPIDMFLEDLKTSVNSSKKNVLAV